MTDSNPYSLANIQGETTPDDSNPYSLGSIQSDQAVRLNLGQAIDKNPEQAAEALRISQATNTPVSAVDGNFKDLQRQQLVDGYLQSLQGAPVTKALIKNPDKAPIVHDDIQNMTDIEKSLSYLSASGRAGLRDFAAAGAKLVDTINPFTTSDEDLAVLYKNDPEGLKRQREQGATAILSRFARNQTAQANAIMQGIPQQTKDAYGDLEYATTDPEKAAYLHPVKVISDAIRSLPTTSAVVLTAALTRGASLRAYNTAIEAGLPEAAARTAGVEAATHLASRFGAASEGSIGYAQQYNSTQRNVEQIPFSELEKSADFNALVDAGYDPNAARIFLSARTGEQSGLGAGVIDAVTSGVGGHYLGKIIGEGGKLLPRIGKGFVNEGLTETVQSGGEQLSENLAIQQHANPDQSLSADVVESMLQGLVVGGFTGGTISGIAGRAATEEKKVLGADLTAQQVEKLNALAASNKVLQRDTQTFEAFVKDASQDGPTNQVFISANALMQSGMAEKIAELSPSVAEQLPLAQNTGGVISIPTDEYMAKIAPTEFSAPLVDHLKFDPEGYSRAEAIEFQQNGYEALANEMAQALNKHQVDEDFHRSKAALRQRFISELNAVGKHPSAVNHAYGTFLAEYFATNAADLGVSPEELHNQYAVKFAQGKIGEGYRQFAGERAQTADIYSRIAAEEMLDKGRSSEAVRQETGWFKGADGKWRFEIPDNEAAFSVGLGSPELEAQLESAKAEQLKAFDEMNDHPIQDGNDPGYAAKYDRYDDASNVVFEIEQQLKRRQFSIDKAETGVEYRLYDILDHPKLFAAYPDLEAIKVRFTKDTRYNGKYLPNEDEIEIAIREADGQRDTKAMLSTLLHEIQHAIQEREGFAMGGNVDHWFVQHVKDKLEGLKLNTDAKVQSWKWQNDFKLESAEQAAQVARYGLMYESAQRLIDYSKRDKPSGVFRLIRNELQWLYAPEFRENQGLSQDASDLHRDFWNVPKSHKMQARNAFIGDMAFRGAQLLLDAIPEQYREQFKNDPRTLKGMVKALQRESDKARKALAPLHDLEKEARAVNDLVDAHKYSSPFEIYRSLAGEVEARNTQARQALTEEERRKTSVAYTQDVEPHKIIVQFGGKEFRAPHTGDLAIPLQIDVDGIQRPTTNSNSQPIHATEEGIRNFWRWFGESKVVDAEGRPLVVYHGTQNPVFDTFKHQNEWNLFGKNDGFYFATKPEEASNYAGEMLETLNKGRQGTGAVMPAYLKADLVADLTESGWNVVDIDVQGFRENLDHEGLLAALKDKYDAIKYDHTWAPIRVSGDHYLVFDPAHIKSATGNNGNFDPNNPNILHQQERGAFDPSTLTIALLEHADLSTFLHETGHFFLEMQFDLAAKLRGEADIFGMDSLRPGEQRIVKDTQAILDWFGIPDINTWYSLDLEQKRPYHEQFARGFEKYLFEGKAPSIELQSLFKKFADWLKKVYKTISEFGDVKLTPEVRGVFDRMLASEEQIHLAEQARSMMPLLEALGKAPMSVDDFERYQRENAEATDEAITELTRRTLGDMKWLRNAKSKALKELQKDSREKRREVRMAVRAEVMSMPIYRAWTLLTAKQGPDNKITPRPKSSPEHVNPEVDNLFVAIAKLGGLNKQELIEEWGIDPAYKPQSGIFGKPVFRAKDGGLSREAMAELLVFHGYLTGDQYGKHDLREFEEKLDDQLRGTDQFSVMHDYSDLLDSRTGDHVNLSSLTAVRFDLGELRVAGLPDDVIKALEDRRMTSKTNGIHQDFVRDMILDDEGMPAFSSGDELARALATAEKPHEVIEALTDVRMLEEYGDIATPEALAQAADLAVLNRFRIKFATTQANALAAATGQRRVLEAAAKQLADTTVGRTLVRYLNPNKYLSAQARAAKAAADHLKKNDVANAAAESRNQVFNMMAARAAMEARDEIKKIDQFFKKVVSGKDDEVGKSRDLDIVNAARAALRRFGYGHKAKTADAYLENVGKYDPELHQVLMGVVGQVDALANSIGSTNQTLTIKDLTVDQLRSLREDIDLLWNQAKRNHEIEVDGKMVNRQFAIDALQEQLSSLGLPESTVGQFHGVTDKEKVAMGIASTVALGKRVEFYIDWLDGGKQMGAFRTFIWNMIKDPATAYRAENARLLRTFRELFDGVKDTFRQGLITAPELGGYTFGEVGGGVALNEILHAIAHTGNNSNKRKLLLGRGWATQRPDGSLDTTHWDAFVSRLIKEGVLTKAHFDFVQGIWDLLESTKPAAQKAHREAYGKYFDEVTANAFMTPFGEYRGGYIPATVDSDQVKDMELKKLIEAGKDGMAYAFPTTNFGSRFSRVEYNRPLLLDLRTLPQHLNKVMLFSHMEMPGRDVRKLLASKEVGGLLNKVDPSAMNAMLMPWLTRSVKQQVSTPQAGLAPINKFASMIRSRVVMASMFANVSNAAQQITGLFPAAHEVGAHRLADSMALYVKDPKAFTANIAELSPMMASRMDDEISAMMDEVNQILLNPDLTKSAQNWSHRHIFFLQSAVDNIVSPIVWRSAFDKALAEDFNVKDAVRIADSVVRKTQGSSQAEDISRFESGPAYARLLTVFSGFFLMQAGWLGSKLGVLMQQGGLRKNAGRAFMIYTLGFAAPMIVSEAISQAMRGGPDDDDKDGSYLDDWLQAVFVTGQIRGATAMVPIAGPVANSVFARFNDNPMDDRLNISPVVTAIEGSGAVPYDLYQNMAGKGNAQRTIRDVGTFMTLFTGMPFSTAAKPIGYAAGVAHNDIKPTGAVDFTRGLITGVASPESKQR